MKTIKKARLMAAVLALFLAICSMATWVEDAKALYIVSDVSYTSNSVSFNIDGDMTGYAPPAPGQLFKFGIVYYGDIWNELSYTGNSWNISVFDNESIHLDGNTGTWEDSHYTWSHYDSDLSDSFSTNRDIVLTMGNSYLNTAAETGSFDIIWGHALNQPTQVIYTYEAASVPEPATMLLLGTGLIGLVGFRRKFKK